MGTTVVIFIAVALAVLLLLAARQPDTFAVSRSLRIGATPELLFSHINDLRAMNRWNPFVQQDPGLQGSYSEPAGGPGARYTFQGRKAGTGAISITSTRPPSQVLMELSMTKPMACANRIEFTLQPVAGGQTEVTWGMSGRAIFLSKVICVFMSMDKMVGKPFEQGLQQLKAIAEAKA